MSKKEPNLLFLLPQYSGQVTTQCFESMLDWAKDAGMYGVDWNYMTNPQATLLPMARSQMISLAMELEDWTHIIMCDADMGFTSRHICELIEADKDYIGALYCAKCYPLQWTASTGDGIYEVEGNLARCKYVPTGLVCIKRETVEKLIDKYADTLAFRPVDGHFNSQIRYEVIDLFAIITNGGDDEDPDFYLTEDYAFCKRVRDAGMEVWQHLGVNPTHTGMHTFSLEEEGKMLERYKALRKI